MRCFTAIVMASQPVACTWKVWPQTFTFQIAVLNCAKSGDCNESRRSRLLSRLTICSHRRRSSPYLVSYSEFLFAANRLSEHLRIRYTISAKSEAPRQHITANQQPEHC